MKQYDIIIIGSGGGTKLRPAADLGKKVAIIEREDLGGTCLNKGCIPSKMLIYPMDLLTHLREDGSHYGISGVEHLSLDFQRLSEQTNQEIQENSRNIKPVYESHPNIDLYQGHGRFIGSKVVQVGEEVLSAEKIYIATGSRPQIPDIPGLEGTPYMTSKEALRNTQLPKKMIIIGGGYIAVELGHVYGAAGVEVHFLVRSGMIKAEDQDIRSAFEEDFSDRYHVHMGTSPKSVSYKDGVFSVELIAADGAISTMQADTLFVATGVVPNSDDLGLEHTLITRDSRGYIEVNEYLETGESGVYALGDVVGNYLFRHSVNFEGEYLFEQHFGSGSTHPIVYPPVPHAIFSYPQVAGVGVREDDLIREGLQKGIDYETAIHTYKSSAMGMAMKPKTGMVKLIADKNSQKLIGAHVLGEKASDIVHMLIVMVSAGMRVDFMLDDMIFIHPALSEVIRNAARTLAKQL